jgi:hypothetical protein
MLDVVSLLRVSVVVVAACCSVLPACSRRATQLVVRVDSDLDADDIGCVHVAVRLLEETGPSEHVFRLGAGGASGIELPFSFGVAPPDGDARRRVELTVSAMAAASAGCRDEHLVSADVTVQRRLRTGFLSEQTLLVPVYLDRRCEQVVCGDDSTCESGICVTVQEIAPSTWTVVDPGSELEVGVADVGTDAPEPTDAGMDTPMPVDARAEDAGSDAATSDAGPPDAGPPDAGGPIMPVLESVLSPADGVSDDRFGGGVAMSADGTRVLVGAAWADPRGVQSGAAYVYVRAGSTWTLEQTLVPSDGAAGDNFGAGVALSADATRAFVGAPQDPEPTSGEPGSVRVFLRTGSVWTEEATLVSTDGAGGLGAAVSASADGDRVVAGAPNDRVGTRSAVGSARVFVRVGTTWAPEGTLPGGGPQFDYFGSAVALSEDGTRALVGGPQSDTLGANSNSGKAHVFARTGSAWALETSLVPPDLARGDYLGQSVALSADGSRALVGAYGDWDAMEGQWQGSVRVFVRSGTAWSHEARLAPADPRFNERLGSSLALTPDGTLALAGAPTSDPGRALLFRRTGTAWALELELSPELAPGEGGGWFGSGVALAGDGSRAMVGAELAPRTTASGPGNASVFLLR